MSYALAFYFQYVQVKYRESIRIFHDELLTGNVLQISIQEYEKTYKAVHFGNEMSFVNNIITKE